MTAAALKPRYFQDPFGAPPMFGRSILGLASADSAKVPPEPPSKSSNRRRKIWELPATLHCSIVGTCLTAGELRTVLRKSDPTIDRQASDHDLHSLAVAAVGKHNELAKRIQKILDQRHALEISRFGRARSAEDLRRCWDESVQNGDIPGAYWAVLTHSLATDEFVRHAFGDVHMLSHLVGAANRADIRRLHRLEQEKAILEEKLARQQDHLRDGIMAREARIRELSGALSARIEREHAGVSGDDYPLSESAALDSLVADLRKQLDLEIRRRERAEKKAQESTNANTLADTARISMERELIALREELDAAEMCLASLAPDNDRGSVEAWKLDGLIILYVGGRSHQVARLKGLVERASGQFLHHDGGIEQRADLLPGLVSRADVAACPVDCVSHTAALAVKRLCRQSDKPFLPLRTSGIASLVRAIGSLDLRVAVRPAV